MQNCKCELLKKIDCASFAAVELRLYLDTHPKCREGLKAYNKYVTLRKQYIEEYEEKFGPMLADSSKNECECYKWVKGPWPWEYKEDER